MSPMITQHLGRKWLLQRILPISSQCSVMRVFFDAGDVERSVGNIKPTRNVSNENKYSLSNVYSFS